MANSNIFSNRVPSRPTDCVSNVAGGKAFLMDERHALAQIAVTNCFNGTYYASANHHLELAKKAANALKNDPQFIAKVALYSRHKAYMKDMPAFLTVILSEIDKPLFRSVFRQVVDNGKMLRNVIQMARSGSVTGKKINVGSGTWRHAIQEWFNSQNTWSLFKASIGNNPSMPDILKMAHPKPNTPEKEALFGYFLGKEIALDKLPEQVRQYEEFKRHRTGPVPDVDFRMLDSLGLGEKEWTDIARNAPWTMTRMNLNTFARHGVFKDESISTIIADRIRDKELIAKSRVFPYQLYVAWKQVQNNESIPFNVKEALQDAMESSIDNVPNVPGNGYVLVDSSGSMGSPVTGYRHGSTSVVQCVEVAGLIASAVVRKNPQTHVYTFNDSAQKVDLNPRDSVATNTGKLSAAGGGTNISAPLRDLNIKRTKGDWVLYISDYESWMDSEYSFSYHGTNLVSEWEKFKSMNPEAKLICCDLTPRDNSQIKSSREDTLHIGGFSDSCFDVMRNFIIGTNDNFWLKEIENYEI